VKLNIQKAQCLGWPKGGEAWDALADYYEPALTAADVTKVFEPLRARLQKLLNRIRVASKHPSNAFNEFALPIDAQEKFVRYMAKRIGFDFNCGRLDRSAHPFCGGSHCRDVRMTTRYILTLNLINACLIVGTGAMAIWLWRMGEVSVGTVAMALPLAVGAVVDHLVVLVPQ
jgi:carboxypeptidase Taq